MLKANQRKRSVILFLFCIQCLSTILPCFSTVALADSNDRRAAYIDLASSGQTTSLSGVSELSYDELRIIGVFLSNFYIPWNTQINVTDDDSKVNENMVTALTDSLNFDKPLAEQLVSTVQSISTSSATKLYLCLYKNDGSWYDVGDKCTYSNLLCVHNNKTLIKNGYLKFRMYWKDDSGKKHTVYQGNIDGSYTPSTTVMNMIYESLKLETGYGSNILALSSKEDGVSPTSKNFGKLLNKYTVDDLYKASSLDWGMYIDAFGNLIVDCGTRQYIVVPACMNPYTWIKDGKKAGQSVNLVNLYDLTLSEEGRLITKDAKSYKDKTTISINYTSPITGNWKLIRGDKADTWSDVHSFLFTEWVKKTDGTALFDSLINKYNNSSYALSKISTSDSWWVTSGLLWNSIQGKNSSKVNVIDDFIYFDTINAFSSRKTNSMSVSKYGIFADNKGTALTKGLNSSSNKFKKCLQAGDCGFNILTGDDAKKYLAGVYASYVFAYFETDGVSNGGHVNYRFNKDGLPTVGSGSLDVSSLTLTEDEQMKELKSMIYYFLHPTDGIAYVTTWFKSKICGILVGWHDDMVGNSSTNSTTGSTKYIGFSGYVTIPNLHDLAWTDWFLNQYDNYIVYLIVFIIILMLGYVMVGDMTGQKAIISIVLFAFCILLPPVLINTVVDSSNSICDSVYSNKFTYWALVQHEQYVKSIASSVASGDESNYLVSLFENTTKNSSNNSAVVSVKWMCPKKDNYLANIQDELKTTSGSITISKLLGGVMKEQYSGEDYVKKANSLYLNRSYTDIGSYSTVSYNNLKLGTNSLNNIRTSSGKDMDNLFNEYTGNSSDASLSSAILNGFNFDTNSSSGVWNYKTNKRFDSALTSHTVSNAIKNGLSSLSSDMQSSCLAGIPQGSFNTTLADFNSKNVNDEQSGLFSYSLYTESPFYYFSWNLYDQINSKSNMATKVLDNAKFPYMNLFSMAEGGYFNNLTGEKNTSGYGDMRDYMDMRSLFTLVIPYLKSANNIVVDWDKNYKLTTSDDIKLEYDATNYLTVPSEIKNAGKDSELYYRYWHNANVAQLFNMYTPWVDTMYDCNYAKGQYITVTGKRYYVTDPLDPSTYCKTDSSGKIVEGRPMIFSESEMKYWGLTKSDLTTVELKLLRIESESYKDLLQLMDYYTFDNEVLNTAAAMIETFNFNKEFSQTGVFGKDYTLFPQSYELKNFSYDAYLRLILAGSTGEDLQSKDNESIYTRVVKNSSITTAIALIILDLFAVYAIPVLKFFFLIAIFTMSILMILSATVRLEIKFISVIINSVFLPLLKFFGITVGLAIIVSLFMTNGNTAVTGRNNTVISLGNPTMVLLVMIILNMVALVLYYRIIKKVVKDGVFYTKAIGTSVAGMCGGVLTAVAKGAFNGKSFGLGGFSFNGSSYVTGSGAQLRGEMNAGDKGNLNTTKSLEKSERKMAKAISKQQQYNKSAYEAENKVNAYKNKQDSINEKINKGKMNLNKAKCDLNKAKTSNNLKLIHDTERKLDLEKRNYTRLQKKNVTNIKGLRKAVRNSNAMSKRAGGKKGSI